MNGTYGEKPWKQKIPGKTRRYHHKHPKVRLPLSKDHPSGRSCRLIFNPYISFSFNEELTFILQKIPNRHQK